MTTKLCSVSAPASDTGQNGPLLLINRLFVDKIEREVPETGPFRTVITPSPLPPRAVTGYPCVLRSGKALSKQCPRLKLVASQEIVRFHSFFTLELKVKDLKPPIRAEHEKSAFCINSQRTGRMFMSFREGFN